MPWHPRWQAPVCISVSSVLTEPVIVLLLLLIVSCLPWPQHNPSSQSLTRGGWWAGGICQADFWKHNTHNHYSVTRNVTLDWELFKSFKLNFQTVKWELSSAVRSLGVSTEDDWDGGKYEALIPCLHCVKTAINYIFSSYFVAWVNVYPGLRF